MKEKLVWSEYQKAIFQDISTGIGNTMVEAVAGSSKTTSLVEGIKHVPKKLKILFVAFNKSIATELDERINRSYVECMTIHSLAYRAVRNSFGSKVVLDNNKSFKIVRNLLEPLKASIKDKDDYDTINSICRTVSLCKAYLIDTPSKIDDLMDDFGIDTANLDREDFIKNVCQTLRIAKDDKLHVDFDDMIWLCVVYNLSVGKWDRVFVDETQDLNKAQLEIVVRAVKPNGRVCAVGDPDQSIYGWNGADVNAMGNIKARLNAKSLPLSISYRCATNIVKLAQEFVPHIEAAPNAKIGAIYHININQLFDKVRPGDFVLSRTNAPLIKYCLAFLKLGIPANIQGRDVGVGLTYLIKQSKKKTVESFLKWLEKWSKEETNRLIKKHRDITIVVDKVECLETLCDGTKSLEVVKDNIKELFSDGDDNSRVIFSTIHRAKGLERLRVFLLNWTFRAGGTKEEKNIRYVAITRAKEELFIVDK